MRTIAAILVHQLFISKFRTWFATNRSRLLHCIHGPRRRLRGSLLHPLRQSWSRRAELGRTCPAAMANAFSLILSHHHYDRSTFPLLLLSPTPPYYDLLSFLSLPPLAPLVPIHIHKQAWLPPQNLLDAKGNLRLPPQSLTFRYTACSVTGVDWLADSGFRAPLVPRAFRDQSTRERQLASGPRKSRASKPAFQSLSELRE